MKTLLARKPATTARQRTAVASETAGGILDEAVVTNEWSLVCAVGGGDIRSVLSGSWVWAFCSNAVYLNEAMIDVDVRSRLEVQSVMIR